MKKAFAIILALSVVLCSSVVFAENDPAVGFWYFLFDFEKYPELRENFGDYDAVYCTYVFLENGNIIEIDATLKDGSPETTAMTNGRWSNENGTYSYRIIGLGEGDFTVNGDELLLYLSEQEFHARLRRVTPFNFYKDYIF